MLIDINGSKEIQSQIISLFSLLFENQKQQMAINEYILVRVPMCLCVSVFQHIVCVMMMSMEYDSSREETIAAQQALTHNAHVRSTSKTGVSHDLFIGFDEPVLIKILTSS